jgi:hypothetical protein
VHVRVAPSDGGSCLNIPRRNRFQSNRSILLFALSACWLVAGCQRPVPARDLKFEWTLTPGAAGQPAVLAFLVHDAAGRPVAGAHLRVEAQMSHPGMAPVLATGTERGEGRYEARLQFTMSGDWIVLIHGSLATGEVVEHRIDLPDVRSD